MSTSEVNSIDMWSIPDMSIQVKKEKSPRIFYYRKFRKNSRKPLIQASIAYTYDELTRKLTWAASFCARGDQFCKRIGRNLAISRMRDQEFNSQTTTPIMMTDKQVRTHIIRQLQYYRNSPMVKFNEDIPF